MCNVYPVGLTLALAMTSWLRLFWGLPFLAAALLEWFSVMQRQDYPKLGPVYLKYACSYKRGAACAHAVNPTECITNRARLVRPSKTERESGNFLLCLPFILFRFLSCFRLV